MVLQALLGVNIVLLIYRIIAAIDAWNVARFLNEADQARIAAAGGRPRSSAAASPRSRSCRSAGCSPSSS